MKVSYLDADGDGDEIKEQPHISQSWTVKVTQRRQDPWASLIAHVPGDVIVNIGTVNLRCSITINGVKAASAYQPVTCNVQVDGSNYIGPKTPPG